MHTHTYTHNLSPLDLDVIYLSLRTSVPSANTRLSRKFYYDCQRNRHLSTCQIMFNGKIHHYQR